MAKGLLSRKKGLALIDRLYKQTKDHATEDMRKRLIENQRKYDVEYKKIRENPDGLDSTTLRKVVEYFNANPHEF